MRVLLVEDSVALADNLCAVLKEAGYAVDWRADGRDALILGEQEPYDLCVLDLGLPGLDGLEVLRRWRAGGITMPVLVLTARSNWSERVEGLRAGADDYLTKPFNPDELVLRAQNILRRSHGREPGTLLEARGLALDEARQEVVFSSAKEAPTRIPVKLSATEFKLLRYLMLNVDRVMSKGRLADHLYEYESERDSNVIEVQINHLRSKLGREVIVTRRGQGYIFVGTPS